MNHIYVYILQDKYNTFLSFRYKMRMGTSNLEIIRDDNVIERKILDLSVHPKYVPGEVYYDVGFNDVFSRAVEALGKKEDVFIGLSTSGNSKNLFSE